MKFQKLTDALKIKEGQEINLPNSRRTGSTFKIKWIGLIHEDEAPGIKAMFFAYKRSDTLGIAYIDDEQLELHDTEVLADEMGISKERLEAFASRYGLKYSHLI